MNKFHKQKYDGASIRRLVSSRDDFWAEKLKATDQRMKILDLLKASYDPISAEDIYKKIKSTHLATVYRTLTILRKTNHIRKVHDLHRKRALFEIKPTYHF